MGARDFGDVGGRIGLVSFCTLIAHPLHAVLAKLRPVLRGRSDHSVGEQHEDIARAKGKGCRDINRVIIKAERRSFRFRREWHRCGRTITAPPKQSRRMPCLAVVNFISAEIDHGVSSGDENQVIDAMKDPLEPLVPSRE
jgi:hypothetical protein